jgi:hypothetical protein
MRARETGDSIRDPRAVAPLRGLERIYLRRDPGACAPGFMLSPASQAACLTCSSRTGTLPTFTVEWVKFVHALNPDQASS